VDNLGHQVGRNTVERVLLLLDELAGVG